MGFEIFKIRKIIQVPSNGVVPDLPGEVTNAPRGSRALINTCCMVKCCLLGDFGLRYQDDIRSEQYL